MLTCFESGGFTFLQWQSGALNDELWASTLGALELQAQSPNNPWRVFWPGIHTYFTMDFQAYIEDLIPADSTIGTDEKTTA